MSSIQGAMVCRKDSYEILFSDFTSDGVDAEMIAHANGDPTHVFELLYRLQVE